MTASEEHGMGVCVIGSLNLDIVCRVAELPRPGETVAGLGVERLPGGKGGNQAVAAALSGVRTTLIGAVGADEAGAIMLAAMRGAGVLIDAVATLADHPTGQAFIWVSAAGENSIVVAGGANAVLTPSHWDASALAGASVFLAQLETPVAAIGTLFTQAATRGGTRILNAAPAVEDGRRLFPVADILIVNETELARYAGAAAVPVLIDDVAAAARGLISRRGQIIVVTLGAAGAVAVEAEGLTLVEGRPAAVVDTTGAGDCFCGVLAARLAVGEGLEAAMIWANRAAALSTERPGAAPSMPTLAEIKAALGI
ncbi:MAG TPA: ribokinase [Caulobacteraceae bacterium]|jgi:ribokinase|nr:ribokinase [Caulobacteraceae bacterium]